MKPLVLTRLSGRTVLHNNCSRGLFTLYLDSYMFRPSLAIIRWNTQYNIYIKELLFLLVLKLPQLKRDIQMLKKSKAIPVTGRGGL
jgi:hypothetical protein